ncbi:MAG: Oxoglutarate dehydrogenase inhibitor [Chlamydiae bacterium]|nr:Oxoglutarate dehydrogenase inhibitor [Chlamydiota bacterium]
MAGFLVAEEGLNAGLVIRFEEGDEWIIGRDPDVSYQVLEDPMVSRKHVICRLTPDGYLLENLSAVNPASVNGKNIEEPILLAEGDAVQIGSDIFHFTLKDPALAGEREKPLRVEDETPTIYEESDDLNVFAFTGAGDARFIIKVISGPNSGAEFGIFEDSTFIIGKDPQSCDILFQDLSVSAQHAKISADSSGVITIEDLGSLNGVYVNGQKISDPTVLNTQDLVALGTTSFLVIDQQQTRETIVAPLSGLEMIYSQGEMKKKEPAEAPAEEVARKNWKKMVIPIRHLVLAGVFALFLVITLGGVFTLFKSESITVSATDERQEISKALKSFPEVEFSFNPSSGKIFMIGHVMTEVDHQEMSYLLKSLPFLHTIEDNVIIDELVWENTNALLVKNAMWRGVNLTSIYPGHFVLRGYVQTIDTSTKLSEYMNLNFPYLDKLDNQVVVENTLEAQIQSILLEGNFVNVTFQLSNGELVLAGRVPSNKKSDYNGTVVNLKKIKGVRLVKNFVVFSQPTSEIIDISSKYNVSGSSKYGNVSQYVVINGKILSTGDNLDGMKITKMQENTIFLEKDGIKYKINYNQP